ncbi:MAG: DegT/DnrJ/EryC1/StrS family aminotransferase [Desulfobacter sp.]|nr:MAG: DegT/DnrJ/EryC1/StrS family aminotransferase [Desulfobacter sp.]
MKIPITRPFMDEIEMAAIQAPLKTGWLVQGPEVKGFETAVARLCRAPYGVAVSSCTAALHLALTALGIGPGDRVVVPSFTYIATANAVTHAGAIPVFADIDPITFNMGPKELEKALGSWEKGNPASPNAVIPVHLFGLCADMPSISDIAGDLGLKVIEDAACALGAKTGGLGPGEFGAPACFSFHPRKVITTGEGGMVVTHDRNLAAGLCRLRDHGARTSDFERHSDGTSGLPDFDQPGYNYRMTDLQGALGNAQLKKLDMIIESRRALALRYNEMLGDVSWLAPPHCPPNAFHTYQSYVCRVKAGCNSRKSGEIRNRLMAFLGENGIAARPGTHAVHVLAYYKRKYNLRPEQFPGAWESHNATISLPLFPQMSSAEQEYIVHKIKAFRW